MGCNCVLLQFFFCLGCKLLLPLHRLQETMTEPSVFAEDVSKLKDAGEIKQAYISLKDTNRYVPSARCSSPLQVFSSPPDCLSLPRKCQKTSLCVVPGLPDSRLSLWMLVTSWVGWGNRWVVAHASWNRASMATLMLNERGSVSWFTLYSRRRYPQTAWSICHNHQLYLENAPLERASRLF